jgi:hypothetical protein
MLLVISRIVLHMLAAYNNDEAYDEHQYDFEGGFAEDQSEGTPAIGMSLYVQTISVYS